MSKQLREQWFSANFSESELFLARCAGMTDMPELDTSEIWELGNVLGGAFEQIDQVDRQLFNQHHDITVKCCATEFSLNGGSMSHYLGVRLSPQDLTILENLGALLGVCRSEAVRRLIRSVGSVEPARIRFDADKEINRAGNTLAGNPARLCNPTQNMPT